MESGEWRVESGEKSPCLLACLFACMYTDGYIHTEYTHMYIRMLLLGHGHE